MTDTTQEPQAPATKQADTTESKQVRELRKESAGYRTRAKDAETRLAEAEKKIAEYEERDRQQAEETTRRKRLDELEEQTGITGLGDILAGADPNDDKAIEQFVEKLRTVFDAMRSRGAVADQSARTGHATPQTDPLKAALRLRRD